MGLPRTAWRTRAHLALGRVHVAYRGRCASGSLAAAILALGVRPRALAALLDLRTGDLDAVLVRAPGRRRWEPDPLVSRVHDLSALLGALVAVRGGTRQDASLTLVGAQDAAWLGLGLSDLRRALEGHPRRCAKPPAPLGLEANLGP